jgi:hypothetical protein
MKAQDSEDEYFDAEGEDQEETESNQYYKELGQGLEYTGIQDY